MARPPFENEIYIPHLLRTERTSIPGAAAAAGAERAAAAAAELDKSCTNVKSKLLQTALAVSLPSPTFSFSRAEGVALGGGCCCRRGAVDGTHWIHIQIGVATFPFRLQRRG